MRLLTSIRQSEHLDTFITHYIINNKGKESTLQVILEEWTLTTTHSYIPPLPSSSPPAHFSAALAPLWPPDGAVAPRPCALLGGQSSTPDVLRTSSSAATRENTRLCLGRLVSHSTSLIKLLLHSRCDALHLFNSSHHKKPRSVAFYEGLEKIDPTSRQSGVCRDACVSIFPWLINLFRQAKLTIVERYRSDRSAVKLDWMDGLASLRGRPEAHMLRVKCSVRRLWSRSRVAVPSAPTTGAGEERAREGEEHGSKPGGCHQRYWSWLTMNSSAPLSLSLSLSLGYRLHYGQSSSIVSLN